MIKIMIIIKMTYKMKNKNKNKMLLLILDKKSVINVDLINIVYNNVPKEVKMKV